jgi:acyl-CoA thioesterase
MQQLRQFLEENDRFAKLLGFHVEAFEAGSATVSARIKEEHLNAANVVHGGFLFSLADFAFALASNSHNRLSLALSANIIFHKAKTGGTLYAHAKELNNAQRVAAYEVSIVDEEGHAVATFTGTVYKKEKSVLPTSF